MQNFREFLKENYGLTEEQFKNVNIYTKRNIEIEWENYIKNLSILISEGITFYYD